MKLRRVVWLIVPFSLLGLVSAKVYQLRTEIAAFEQVASESALSMDACLNASDAGCVDAVHARLLETAQNMASPFARRQVNHAVTASATRAQEYRQRLVSRQILAEREARFYQRQAIAAVDGRLIGAERLAAALRLEEQEEYVDAAVAALSAVEAWQSVPAGPRTQDDDAAQQAAESALARIMEQAAPAIGERTIASAQAIGRSVRATAGGLAVEFAARATARAEANRCADEPVFNFRGGNNGLDRLLAQLPRYRRENRTRDCTAFIRYREPDYCWQVRCIVDDDVIGAASVVFAFNVNQYGGATEFRILEAL